MFRFIRETLRPDAYHGHRKRPPFFEGWYFKLVNAAETERYAIIPGIFKARPEDEHENHAFIQVMNGTTGHSTYHRFSPGEFWADEETFDLRIGPNRFGSGYMQLDLDRPERAVHGELHFDGITPWPVSLTSPGIMGWYAWVPLMETYHGVVSLDHTIEGALEVDGQAIDLTGGRGYIEKDWGRSFPAAWIWIQTNHFDRPGVCLTASVAIIPWLWSEFTGFIVGLLLDGRLYRFATYTGARIDRLEVSDQHINWAMENNDHRLELMATRTQGGLLQAPTPAGMGRRITETMTATVEVQLTAKKQSQPRFAGTGRNAGLEVMGDLERLLGGIRR